MGPGPFVCRAVLIPCDRDGSNSSRERLRKLELQGLAGESGMRISVCPFPLGTSKWKKSEHWMFCHTTQNWRGRHLVCREVIVNLTGAVTTKAGLRIESELDEKHCELGRKVTDAEPGQLSIRRAEFHGGWNYTLLPRDHSTTKCSKRKP